MLTPTLDRVSKIACSLAVFVPALSQADALADSHLTLGTRNYYQDRDFHQNNAPKSRIGSWSQGFDLQFKSGYTDTPVQFGLDAAVQYAYRLDGSAARAPDQTLPTDHNGQPVRDYGRGGLTAKARYSKTEVKVGEHRPTLPVAFMDDSHQLVTTFEGATIESREWDRLTLNAGRFWQIATRESSNREDIYLFGHPASQSSDGLNFAGARYEFTPALNATYYYAQLEDIYQQQYVALAHTAALGDGYTLKSDARYYHSKGEGSEVAGVVDNQALGFMESLRKGGHAFSLGYQRMIGETGFPTFNGFAPQPTLVNWSALAFIRANERSWQLRYDYDFAAMGVPGLRFMTRYLRGTDIKRAAGQSDDVESERNFVLSYVLQSGPLQGLAFEARNIAAKTRYGADFDENRLITTYTWKFW